MKKTLMGLAAVAAAALALTACAGGSDGSGGGGGEGQAEGGTQLRIGNFLDVTSWDPSSADIGFDGPYLSAIYDPLLAINDKGEPQPALATQWETSEDFLTITLDIRTDAKFSTGTPVDADAVVKSLEYLKDGIRSNEAYQKVDSFEKVDDDTVAIHLTERDDTILYFMGLGRSYVMDPEAIDAGTLAETPVGSGPYTLSADSIPGGEYKFDKVVDHWAAADFAFDPLVITPANGDPTALLNGMEGGQFDLIYGDPTGVEMAPEKGWNVSSDVATWNGLQITDRTGEMVPALGDKRVRQALNLAFSGEDLLASVRQGIGAVTNQVFPDGGAGNLPELNSLYEPANIEEAKKLLAEAGYADGFDVTMPMAGPFQAWQPTIEQVFGELGIRVTFDEYQFQDYMGNVGNYPMFVAVLAMDSNPVATVERQIANPQWYNPRTGLDAHPEIQAQVDAVFSAEPGDAQIAEIEKLNTMVTEEAWFAVWLQSNNSYVSAANIEVQPVVGMMFPTLRQISVVG